MREVGQKHLPPEVTEEMTETGVATKGSLGLDPNQEVAHEEITSQVEGMREMEVIMESIGVTETIGEMIEEMIGEMIGEKIGERGMIEEKEETVRTETGTIGTTETEMKVEDTNSIGTESPSTLETKGIGQKVKKTLENVWPERPQRKEEL